MVLDKYDSGPLVAQNLTLEFSREGGGTEAWYLIREDASQKRPEIDAEALSVAAKASEEVSINHVEFLL